MAPPDHPSLTDRLSLDDLATLVAGADLWHTPALSHRGVPALRLTDGPNGARGPHWAGQGALCVPCGAALAATWDPDLVAEVAAAIAEDARSKGAHVLLAPTVNLHRHPLAGRTFECPSEDPHLAARYAVAYVRGVQSRGVAATVKHLVANDSEFERHTISSEVDEVTLRELYLRPFEAAVRNAGAWAVMAAYNRLGGTYCSEHPWLLRELLRDEWGFDGVVMSDWFGTHSTAAAAAGLDLEMPGPPVHFGPKLADAVRDGTVAEARVREMAGRILTLATRTGALGRPAPTPSAEPGEDERPGHRAIARRAAAAATVLLTNRDALVPLDLRRMRRIALIGPGSDAAWIMGGGSASLTPYRVVTPLDGLRAALDGSGVDLVHERGPAVPGPAPVIGARHLDGGTATLEVVARGTAEAPEPAPEPIAPHGSSEPTGAPETSGTGAGTAAPTAPPAASAAADAHPLLRRRIRELRQMWVGPIDPALPPLERLAIRVRAGLRVPEPGTYTLGFTTVDAARVLLDGHPVIDARHDRPPGESFWGFGSVELRATVELAPDRTHDLTIEYLPADGAVLGGFALGLHPPDPADALERAVAAARDADAAVVVVGTGPATETEGRDRSSLHLPGRQDELVHAVAAATPRTVVCVQAGAPVALDWADEVAAVLWCWFAGQEAGHALADVLLGRAEPAGRLPFTIPARLEDTPSHPHYPGGDGKVTYGEGLCMGYRGFDRAGTEPRFCFGHGLGWSSWSYGDPSVATDAVTGTVTVEVPVTNTGTRRSREVVQCYLHRPERLPGPERPPQELVGFTGVEAGPGETVTATVTLPPRALAVWWPGTGWTVPAGRVELRLGRSSRDLPRRVAVEVQPTGL